MTKRRVASVVVGLLVPGAGQVIMGREARGLAVWIGLLTSAVVMAYAGAGDHPAIFSALLVLVVLLNLGAVANAARTTQGPLRSMGATLALVVVAATASMGVQLGVRRWVMEMFKVPAGSMVPTIRPGDHIVVDKRARTPSRGDVVVFRQGKTEFVKRVIATGGDRIAFTNGAPIVNGRAVPEAPKTTRTVEGQPVRVLDETLDGHTYEILRSTQSASDTDEVILMPDELYVVGDHRDNSRDSRYFGPVKLDDVMGTARFVWGGAKADRFVVELR